MTATTETEAPIKVDETTQVPSGEKSAEAPKDSESKVDDKPTETPEESDSKKEESTEESESKKDSTDDSESKKDEDVRIDCLLLLLSRCAIVAEYLLFFPCCCRF